MNRTYSVAFVCVRGGLLKSAPISKSLPVRWVQPHLLIVLYSAIREAYVVNHGSPVGRVHFG